MKHTHSRLNKVNFDVCTVCNHICGFCPNHDSRTPKHVLTSADFQTVMDDLTGCIPVSEIGLSAKGEPLLNPQLPEIIRLAKERYDIPYVYISTNGSLLDPQVLNVLLDAGLDSIKVSLNAFDRETYATVHGKDHFDRVISILNKALDLRKGRYFKLLISTVTETTREDVIEHLNRLLKGRAAELNHVFVYAPEYREGVNEACRDLGDDYTPCAYLFGREVYIDPQCNLVPCCNDYFGEIRLGNLLKNRFEELWDGAPFAELRDMHVSRTLDRDHICYKCLAHIHNMLDNDAKIASALKKEQD